MLSGHEAGTQSTVLGFVDGDRKGDIFRKDQEGV